MSWMTWVVLLSSDEQAVNNYSIYPHTRTKNAKLLQKLFCVFTAMCPDVWSCTAVAQKVSKFLFMYFFESKVFFSSDVIIA